MFAPPQGRGRNECEHKRELKRVVKTNKTDTMHWKHSRLLPFITFFLLSLDTMINITLIVKRCCLLWRLRLMFNGLRRSVFWRQNVKRCWRGKVNEARVDWKIARNKKFHCKSNDCWELSCMELLTSQLMIDLLFFLLSPVRRRNLEKSLSLLFQSLHHATNCTQRNTFLLWRNCHKFELLEHENKSTRRIQSKRFWEKITKTIEAQNHKEVLQGHFQETSTITK